MFHSYSKKELREDLAIAHVEHDRLRRISENYEEKIKHLERTLSQQANEFRYILLEVARIGDVNLDMYTKFNQYEKQPRVNFKLLREDLQANDREIERVARLDSLGPTLPR